MSEHIYTEIGEQNPSPPSLPLPEMTESMDEEEPIIESIYQNYQAHVSVPSHFKRATPRPTKRGSTAAELAYLYGRKDAEFELPFHPKQAGVTDVVEFLYEEPTSLSRIPAPRRNRYRKAMQQRNMAEVEMGSYPHKTQIETTLL